MSLTYRLAKPIGRNVRDLMLKCGVGPKLKAPDRQTLEQSVHPYISKQQDLHRILDVGCHWYTWRYGKYFQDKDYVTLEIDPKRARYGAPRHIVDSVENVRDHFAPDSLDAVLLLGVVGWGLNDEAQTERAVSAIRACLRDGGLFILAWDDDSEHKPFEIEAMQALGGFRPWVMPPLGTSRYACESLGRTHVFNFYRAVKPSRVSTSEGGIEGDDLTIGEG